MPPGSIRSHMPTEKAPLATRSAGNHLGSSSPPPAPSRSKQARGAAGPASGPEASTAGWHQVSSSWSSCSGVAWHVVVVVAAAAVEAAAEVAEAVEVEMVEEGVSSNKMLMSSIIEIHHI